MGGHDHNTHPYSTRSKRVLIGAALSLVVTGASAGLSIVPAAAAPTTTTTIPGTTTIPAPRPDAPLPTPALDAAPPVGLPAGGPTALALGMQQATQLQLEMAANAKRADILDENYLKAQRAVAVGRRKVAAAQAQLDTTRSHVDDLHHQLAGRAAYLYMGAGTSDPIGFDATNVEQLGAMAKYGDAAAQRDQEILADLAATQQRLGAQQRDLERDVAAARHRQRAAHDARLEVARVNASMKKLLDTTQASVKLLAARMEQDAQAAAALAEQDWLQRQAKRQADAAKGVGSAPGTTDPTDPGGALTGLPTPSGGALLAVAYAEKQLGKPYVYAGAGPDVFDCSGLTMMAWAQAGVSMVHGSQWQYDAFPHVPIDQLQPGDLVFFGDTGPTNHHVGIVVGPGLMIDAPHTGAWVELVSYFRPDLVPLGARPTSPSP